MAIQSHDARERLRLEVLAALAQQVPADLRMSYEEFLAWADEDTLAEWVDGRIVRASPASLPHQLIVKFLLRVMSSYAEIHTLGEVLEPPFQMRLAGSGREPDVLFVATGHLDRLKKTYLDGPADVAIEVLSPESVGRDRGEKFFEYQDGGVREYWLVDTEREFAEFYQLDEGGHYALIAPDADGFYTSRGLAGFRLRVAWLWLDPLPDPVDALLEVDREAYTEYLRGKLG